jgi:hypothetical protein
MEWSGLFSMRPRLIFLHLGAVFRGVQIVRNSLMGAALTGVAQPLFVGFC